MNPDLDAPLRPADVDAAVALPPLPKHDHAFCDPEGEQPDILVWRDHSMQAYARTAVLAERAESARLLRVARDALQVVEQSNYGRDWVWPETAHAQAMSNVREALATIRAHLGEGA